MTSREVQAAKDYLLGAGEPELAALIIDSESPYPIWDSLSERGQQGRYLRSEDSNKIHSALVVGHQVHDPYAHLTPSGSVCCPTHRTTPLGCEIHGTIVSPPA